MPAVLEVVIERLDVVVAVCPVRQALRVYELLVKLAVKLQRLRLVFVPGAALGEVYVVYLVKRRDVLFVARDVKLRAQREHNECSAHCGVLLPAPGEHPQRFLHQHLRAEPADERPDRQHRDHEHRRRYAVEHIVKEPVVHGTRKGQRPAYGHAVFERGSEPAHCHNVPGKLHASLADYGKPEYGKRKPHDAEAYEVAGPCDGVGIDTVLCTGYQRGYDVAVDEKHLDRREEIEHRAVVGIAVDQHGQQRLHRVLQKHRRNVYNAVERREH